MRLAQLTLISLCIVLTASVVMAKDKKPEKQMDPQAMMEVYAKLATPGEPHKQFCKSRRQLGDEDQILDGTRQAANGIYRIR